MQSPDGSARDLAGVLEQLVRFIRHIPTGGRLGIGAASALALLVRQGPCRLTDLAAHEGVSQPGMTQLVTRLERDGLVRRTPGAEDRRVVMVEATDAGREVLEHRRAQRVSALRHLLDQLDPEDQAALRAALPALTRLLALAPSVLSTDPRHAHPGDTE